MKNIKNKQIVVIIIAVVSVWIAFIFGAVLLILNSQKSSEEYQLSYQYLVSSSAFEELNTDESFIFMNRHYSGPNRSRDCDSDARTVEFGFLVGFRTFDVVCHRENDEWQICSECTPFD